MTEQEQERFEAGLRRIQPGRLPADLAARLRTAAATDQPHASGAFRGTRVNPGLMQLLRWLLPATAAVVIVAAIWPRSPATGDLPVLGDKPQPATASAPPSLQPDNIEIGRELVSSFDAVATLPGGEPVRFRCQKWMDQVVVSDKSRGLLVENRTPRVVVVPVGFEVY